MAVASIPEGSFEYDVAVSFAGEQRTEAEAIAKCLRDSGVSVFYDKYEQADLWGKDLFEHLAEVYERKARYCLMFVSQAYANKVWTSHERRNAQARALSQRSEYILPVRFDETKIPGLPETIGYLRFEEHGAQGVCEHLLNKLNRPRVLDKSQQVLSPSAVVDANAYWEQRKLLPETALAKKILSRPRWRIWTRPVHFKKARFQNVDHCRGFIQSFTAKVPSRFPHPWLSGEALHTDREWIAGETDTPDGGKTPAECRALFRSGQLVQNRALSEILKDSIHVLEILTTVTAAFEVAAEMAQQGVLSSDAAITFDLCEIDGRRLSQPLDLLNDALGGKFWCQDPNITVERPIDAEIQALRREIALGVALEIYSMFGWLDAPEASFAKEQLQRFGPIR